MIIYSGPEDLTMKDSYIHTYSRLREALNVVQVRSNPRCQPKDGKTQKFSL
jgi:hypothetical protein